jgi:hypothetical protein
MKRGDCSFCWIFWTRGEEEREEEGDEGMDGILTTVSF